MREKFTLLLKKLGGWIISLLIIVAVSTISVIVRRLNSPTTVSTSTAGPAAQSNSTYPNALGGLSDTKLHELLESISASCPYVSVGAFEPVIREGVRRGFTDKQLVTYALQIGTKATQSLSRQEQDEVSLIWSAAISELPQHDQARCQAAFGKQSVYDVSQDEIDQVMSLMLIGLGKLPARSQARLRTLMDKGVSAALVADSEDYRRLHD